MENQAMTPEEQLGYLKGLIQYIIVNSPDSKPQRNQIKENYVMASKFYTIREMLEQALKMIDTK